MQDCNDKFLSFHNLRLFLTQWKWIGTTDKGGHYLISLYTKYSVVHSRINNHKYKNNVVITFSFFII